MKAVVLVLVFGLAGLTLGCDKKSDDNVDYGPLPPLQAGNAKVAEAIGEDAASVSTPIDPPAPAGDLRAELDGFTTLDACVTQHASMDPLVGDAIHALGYQTFLRDACRVLSASKQKDAKVCAAIDASGLRARCRAIVAMISGDPDACPWVIPDVPARGREPTCLAVTTHDSRVCAAETGGSRSTCEALATHELSRCAAGDPGERAACLREAMRYARVIEPPPSKAKLPAPHAALTIHGANGTPDPADTDVDATGDVDRGAIMDVDRLGAARIEIGARRDLGAVGFGPVAGSRARFSVSLVHGPADRWNVDAFELAVPGGVSLASPGVRFDGRVAMKTLEHARGGAVSIAIEGTIGVSPHTYAIRVEIDTFVRDVVDERRARSGP